MTQAEEGGPGPDPSGASSPAVRLGVIPVCLMAWIGVVPALLALPWAFTWDTAPYLETASSILPGRGLMHPPEAPHEARRGMAASWLGLVPSRPLGPSAGLAGRRGWRNRGLCTFLRQREGRARAESAA